MRGLAREVRPGAQPAQTAHWLMEGSLQADLLAEVERGRVVRLVPLEDNSPLDAASAAEMKRKYLGLCQQEYGGGDCLGLLADGTSRPKTPWGMRSRQRPCASGGLGAVKSWLTPSLKLSKKRLSRATTSEPT